MNNDQFRRLALGAGSSAGSNGGANRTSSSPGSSGVLGSRQKASIPMTPRSGANVSRVAFAKQMAERYQDAEKQKKFRTSRPKGSRLAEGYVDRAKLRADQEKADEREARLAALEELHKNGEVDQATYEKLRLEITGEDLSDTPLVRGLDFKLLQRAGKGDNVFGDSKTSEEQDGRDFGDSEEVEEGPVGSPTVTATAAAEDVDDEFGRLEETEVQAIEREKTKKKGQFATTALAPGKKRTRDQILAELKAARETAKQKEESMLGSRFKKIGATQAAGSRIERDSRGREVLVIVDEDGHEKRKVRKLAADTGGSQQERDREAMAPVKDKEVLGMEVPEFYRKKLEAEAAAAAAKEDNIFDDAGSDYDPLADMGSEDSDSELQADKLDEKEKEPKKLGKDGVSPPPLSVREEGEASDSSQRKADLQQRRVHSPSRSEKEQPPTSADQAAPRRNYFKDTTLMSEQSRNGPSLNDPSVLAALRKAKQMREATESEEKSKEAEREERLKRLLRSADRDAEDLDMGFGTNRLEDEEDMEGGDGTKLSTWGAGDDGEESRGGKSKRKRGPKKRKGDGNSAADVMRVLEKRREAGAS